MKQKTDKNTVQELLNAIKPILEPFEMGLINKGSNLVPTYSGSPLFKLLNRNGCYLPRGEQYTRYLAERVPSLERFVVMCNNRYLFAIDGSAIAERYTVSADTNYSYFDNKGECRNVSGLLQLSLTYDQLGSNDKVFSVSLLQKDDDRYFFALKSDGECLICADSLMKIVIDNYANIIVRNDGIIITQNDEVRVLSYDDYDNLEVILDEQISSILDELLLDKNISDKPMSYKVIKKFLMSEIKRNLEYLKSNNNSNDLSANKQIVKKPYEVHS